MIWKQKLLWSMKPQRSKDKLISDIFKWILAHGCIGQPTKFYMDTGCNLEDMSGAMDDRDRSESQSGNSVLSVWLNDDDIL